MIAGAPQAPVAPPAGRWLSGTLLAVVNVLGAGAFLFPFLTPAEPGTGDPIAHASDAPVLFALLAPLLLAVAVAEIRGGRLDARRVALLGVLSAVNAVLRLPGSLAGANLMFFLPIVCGYVFGAGFGFLLGATSMAVAGAITGGVGPWLPFQMWAMGWFGAGAGLLRGLGRFRGRWPVTLGLAAYGWVAGLAFGALTNLWFWPYLSGAEAISWAPGIGAGEAARRYWRFYAVTSLAWDSVRAVVNATLVLTFGRPIVRVLERFRRRFPV